MKEDKALRGKGKAKMRGTREGYEGLGEEKGGGRWYWVTKEGDWALYNSGGVKVRVREWSEEEKRTK